MKVVNLKQAILQAWKERWSDYQWAINMKRFFPRGATWDILNLAGGERWGRGKRGGYGAGGRTGDEGGGKGVSGGSWSWGYSGLALPGLGLWLGPVVKVA